MGENYGWQLAINFYETPAGQQFQNLLQGLAIINPAKLLSQKNGLLNG